MKRALLSALVLSAASCESPPVYSTQDPAQNVQLSHIDGNVIVQSVARGNAVLFLFDVNRPPPPAGNGKPLSFTVVSEADIFGQNPPQGEGPFTAPFHFSLVPPGSYLIQGFIDLNGCFPRVNCRSSSFVPWYTATDEPNSGDVGGAAADPTTSQPTVVTVNANTAAENVSVGFVDANVFPIDRPAFSAICAPGTNCTTDMLPTTPVTNFAHFPGTGMPAVFALSPEVGLVAGNATLTGSFFAQYVSVVNGVPQDLDGDPMNGPDLWPKVIVRKVDPSNPLNDENVDRRGLPLPDAGTAQVVLEAGVVPTNVIPLLTTSGGQAITTPVPIPPTQPLEIAVFPQALDVSNPAAPMPLMQVPPGLYAIYIIQFTGQTWRVPNELGPSFAPILGFTPTTASQGFFIEVP